MKKITSLFALAISLVAASAMAEDSYLYWLADTTGTDFNWQYAELFAQPSEGSATSLAFYDAGSSVKTSPTYVTTTLPSGYDGFSYYVELISSEGDLVASSTDPIAYSTLAAAIRNQSSMTSVTPYTFGSFTAAPQPTPEPTSGMMLLMGLALVGLKRKRAC